MPLKAGTNVWDHHDLNYIFSLMKKENLLKHKDIVRLIFDPIHRNFATLIEFLPMQCQAVCCI